MTNKMNLHLQFELHSCESMLEELSQTVQKLERRFSSRNMRTINARKAYAGLKKELKRLDASHETTIKQARDLLSRITSAQEMHLEIANAR